jgi:hypothetical protein
MQSEFLFGEGKNQTLWTTITMQNTDLLQLLLIPLTTILKPIISITDLFKKEGHSLELEASLVK